MRSDAGRFWLNRAATSSLLAGLGFVIGFIPAYVIGFVVAGTLFGVATDLGLTTSSLGTAEWIIAVAAGAAGDGLAIGLLVGLAQTALLRRTWPDANRMRWLKRSISGWVLGPMIGAAVSLSLVGLDQRGGLRDFGDVFGSRHPFIETSTVIAGLVLGWMLREVPPSRPRSLPVWLAGHVAAVSGGWILGLLLRSESTLGALSFPTAFLGAAGYGIVSGLVMLTVVQPASAPAATTPVQGEADAEEAEGGS